jgi:adenine-specific DNA methylase
MKKNQNLKPKNDIQSYYNIELNEPYIPSYDNIKEKETYSTSYDHIIEKKDFIPSYSSFKSNKKYKPSYERPPKPILKRIFGHYKLIIGTVAILVIIISTASILLSSN